MSRVFHETAYWFIPIVLALTVVALTIGGRAGFEYVGVVVYGGMTVLSLILALGYSGSIAGGRIVGWMSFVVFLAAIFVYWPNR